MQPSDAYAHSILALVIDAGGSFTVKLSSTMPELVDDGSGHLIYSNITVITAVSTSATIPRATASWGTPTARSVIPVADVSLGTAAADFVAVAYVLYVSGTAVHCGRLADTTVSTGAPVVLPKETIRLTIPSS
jgi:hypothetical protein